MINWTKVEADFEIRKSFLGTMLDRVILPTSSVLAPLAISKVNLLQNRPKMENMLQNTADLSELNTNLIEKPENDGIVLLTVVFWDIKGFSNLCDVLKTHSTLLLRFLREFFEIPREIIFEYVGVSDKYMGDGVMALFVLKAKVEKAQQTLFVPVLRFSN